MMGHNEPFDPTCDQCLIRSEDNGARIRRNYEENWSGVSFASVPGGNSMARVGQGSGDTKYTPSESQQVFDKNLDDYREAKKEGLQPSRSDSEAVEQAQIRQESFGRLNDRHDKGEIELSRKLET